MKIRDFLQESGVRSWSAALTQQESRLRQTEVAQLSAIIRDCIGFSKLSEFGESCSGHSYGGLTALAASGRIVDTDFHRLPISRSVGG